MLTTIDLPDDLVAEATARAAQEGRSMSEIVADAVRSSFARTAAENCTPAVVIPTFGACGTQPTADLDKSAALLEFMEEND